MTQNTHTRNLPMAVGIADQPIDTVDLRKAHHAVHDVHRITVVAPAALPSKERQGFVVVARVPWRPDFQHLPLETPLTADVHLLDAGLDFSGCRGWRGLFIGDCDSADAAHDEH